MKKLVGGDYLLDLTPIELEQSEDGETYTNITNKEIIEQLTNLKKFVPNPSMVKPVWVKLINGETDEIVVVRGEFKVVDADEFEIVVAIDGYKLKIHIEFTQALNENNDPIDDWYIDTNDAKYLFTSDAQNVKAIIENENFGDVELAGDLSVGGDITGDSIIENMTGYSLTPGATENYTYEHIYSGVVKNGNKITFVMALNLTKGEDALNYSVMLAQFGIPASIGAKLYPTQIGSFPFLDVRSLDAFSNHTSSVELKAYCSKDSNTGINFVLGASNNMVVGTKYFIRYECTFLLSDNMIPESQGE